MKASALAILLALTGSSFAGAPDTSKNPVVAPPEPESDAGFFIGNEVGSFRLNNFNLGQPIKLDYKFQQGWESTVPVGYDFGNGLSALLSGGYYKDREQHLTLHDGSISQRVNTWGNYSFLPLMASGSYSIKIVGNLSWYIGGGLGAIHEAASWPPYDRPRQLRLIHFNKLHNDPVYLSGMTVESWEFGFQAFTGLSYQLSSHISVNAGYHYLNVDSHVTVNGASSPALQGQTGEVGVIWKF